MSRSVNKVILMGNLGRDAETKFTSGGTAVSTFSIATSRRWKDQGGEWKEETDWHNIVLWKNEKLAEYLTRGKQAHVIGRLQTRTYEKDGEKKYVTEIVAEDVVLCGGGQKEDDGFNQERKPARKPAPMPKPTPVQNCPDGGQWGGVTDDDVPF